MKQIYALIILSIVITCCYSQTESSVYNDFFADKIIERANNKISISAVTITSVKAERSLGGMHDYFSEGPYWWADSTNLSGPYIRRDGIRNPNNFNAHRTLLKSFETSVTDLTAAFILTNESKYAEASIKHLDAWFLNEDTKMNPNLLYAQAIKGISSGRGIGIIDAIGLINVANAITILHQEGKLTDTKFSGYKLWFEEFVVWLTSHPYGIEEKNNNNNHSTWWGAQVASYSILTKRNDLLEIAISQFKTQLDIQMDSIGGFPDELSRTKPFHYMNYNLEAWNVYASIISHSSENLWEYRSKNGSLRKADEFAFNYFTNLETWPYKTDIESDVQISNELYFWLASKGYSESKYFDLWKANASKQSKKTAELILWQYILKK